jgi:hypothetical protein
MIFQRSGCTGQGALYISEGVESWELRVEMNTADWFYSINYQKTK